MNFKTHTLIVFALFTIPFYSVKAQQPQNKMKISTVSIEEDNQKNSNKDDQKDTPRENKKKEKMITKPYTKTDTVKTTAKPNGGNKVTENKLKRE